MKIKEFRGILEKKGADFAVFYNFDSTKYNANMLYFSGYSGIGALVIPSKKEPFLIAPQMEFQRARKSSIRKVFSMDKKRFFESIYNIAKKNKLKAKIIALDKSAVTLNAYRHIKEQFKKAKAKDIAYECLKLREIKTSREIQFTRKSCAYADKIIQKLIKNFNKFKTESEAAAFLEYETKKKGLDIAFEPIVASGSNASMPHHKPANEKIKNGFCVIDFGVKYDGYCSDITRTVYVGNPSKKEKEIYNFLLKIQEDSIQLAESNKKCSELYDFVNTRLGKYKKYFTHGLGHGVGVEIHEMPNLTLNSKDRVTDNMVFTIEPGIYIPQKFGIRIEDTVLFSKKPIRLTKTSKDLLII
ncbi:aminopeptidase P family protein [Candidatus Woesearchaeota archaeon]|nr:aminopeptidase P family protein [Candidatus Woesearchaeota archaeon]